MQMRDIAKVTIGLGTLIGIGVIVSKCKKVKDIPEGEIREFRCVRDARYYGKIVDRFNGDSAAATLWMVRNYEYPYNYSQIYEDIRSGKAKLQYN